MNINNNNAYKNYTSTSPVIKRRQAELTVIEGTKNQASSVPSDRDMSLKEKILMNVLVWGGFVWVAWLFVTGDWWQ